MRSSKMGSGSAPRISGEASVKGIPVELVRGEEKADNGDNAEADRRS